MVLDVGVKGVPSFQTNRYDAVMPDERRHAPATVRNRDPILALLRAVLPAKGLVLEIASGSGEHAIHFSRALRELTWQPSDPAGEARASIAAWRDEEGPPNLLAPLALDAACADWPITHADAIVCINMHPHSCYPLRTTA